MADNVTGAVDVPLELFGGLNTELAPSDIPEGVSPSNVDVAYLPGSVFQRPGMKKVYGSPTADAVYFAESYVQPNEDPLTIFAAGSNLYSENISISPGTYTKIGTLTASAGTNVSGATNQGVAVTAFGRMYIAFSDGLHGSEVPLQYDGTNLDRVSQDGPGQGPGAADSAAAGHITAGQHQYVVMFLTRQGYITAPSPPQAWTAAGNFKVTLSNIPVGPPNVVARIIAFTGAGGDNFFYIPVSTTLPAVVSATVINDNTTLTADLDFSDDALFASIAIDVPGNNLFAQVVLGPCLGVASYASRLFWWGERNKVQNFLNMGFDGGHTGLALSQPLGWHHGSLTGGLASGGYSGWALGFGSNSTWDQPAYQDSTGTAILQQNTQYSVRFYCQEVTNPLLGAVLVVDFYSPSQGVLASATFGSLTNTLVQGQWDEIPFSAKTPSQIPADTILRITSASAPGASFTIDELEILYTDNPYRDGLMRGSYIENPEAFDGVTGDIGPTSDPTPIREPFVLRNNLYLVTGDGMHQTQDNANSEPSGWSMNQLNQNTGGVSCQCVATGEDWAVIGSPSGLRIFEGGTAPKISQEIQTVWESRDTAKDQRLIVANDGITRRIFVGMTLQSGEDVMQVLDYRELDSETQVAASGPVHISFTGKMISSDLTRKWTTWNVGRRGAMLNRTFNTRQFCAYGEFGAGGNIYTFDAAKLTDDDNGEIFPAYFTYFFVNHEQEEALQLGSHRKLVQYVTMFATGVGYINVVPYVNNLTNAWPAFPVYPLVSRQDFDLEWGANVTGNRIAFKIYPTPITDAQNPNYTNGTDKYFSLNKMVVAMRQDPWSPVAGSIY